MEAILTNCCMIKNKGKVLIQDRKKKDWPGVAFPGGHVEMNEAIVSSTIREIKEETGLDIFNLKFRGFKSWFDKKDGKEFWQVIFFYGGKKNRGVAPSVKAKGSGSIARVALQQLEEAGFVRALKSGRVVAPQGQSMLDNVAFQVKQDLVETIPGLAKY